MNHPFSAAAIYLFMTMEDDVTKDEILDSYKNGEMTRAEAKKKLTDLGSDPDDADDDLDANKPEDAEEE